MWHWIALSWISDETLFLVWKNCCFSWSWPGTWMEQFKTWLILNCPINPPSHIVGQVTPSVCCSQVCRRPDSDLSDADQSALQINIFSPSFWQISPLFYLSVISTGFTFCFRGSVTLNSSVSEPASVWLIMDHRLHEWINNVSRNIENVTSWEVPLCSSMITTDRASWCSGRILVQVKDIRVRTQTP